MYKIPSATDSGIDISYDDHVPTPRPSPKLLEKPEAGEDVLMLEAPAIQAELELYRSQQLQKQQLLLLPPTPSPSPPPPQKQSPSLLTLPYELRLEIYSYLLEAPSRPGSNKKAAAAAGTPWPRLHAYALLRTCGQLYAECTAYLLTRNEFTAHRSLLAGFPRLLGADAAPVTSAAQTRAVRRLRVPVRLDAGVSGYDAAEAARQLSGRAEVVLVAERASWRAAGPDNLALFEKVRGVRTARVVGSIGGFEDYARWLEKAMMAPLGCDVVPGCPSARGMGDRLTRYN